MATESTPNGWTILDKDAGVLCCTYKFTASGTANAFAARMANGEMLIISPPARASDGLVDDLAAFGKVGALVANNGFHYLGQALWRKKFPDARCFADPGAVKRIEKKSGGVGDFEPMDGLGELTGDSLVVRAAPGAKAGETWAWANSDAGAIWYASDLLSNMERFAGNFLFRIAYKATKSGPGYRPFHLAMIAMLKDKKTALRALLADLRANPPSTVVVGHGDLVTDPDQVASTETMIAEAAGAT